MIFIRVKSAISYKTGPIDVAYRSSDTLIYKNAKLY